jgi:hypothetical protein
MKKAALTVTAVMTMLVAGPAQAQSPRGDSIVGDGRVLSTDFVVNVQVGRFGIPTGVLNLTGFVQGTAYPSCLKVSGNTGVAAYRLVDGSNAGRGFIAEVVDNGSPVNGQPVDVVTYAGYVDSDPPQVCPDPGQGPPAGFSDVGAGPLTSGDVIVHDASGLPAPGSDGVVGVARDCLHVAFGSTFCDRTFFFDAFVEAGPRGENPRGDVQWYDSGPTPGASSSADTTVSCLSVSDRVAIIGVTGQWERYGVGLAVFPIAGLVRVVDGGGPDAEADNVQFAIRVGAESGPPVPGPTNCSTFPGTFPTGIYAFPDFTNETGDLLVVDVPPPLPTSKDQCRNGGWRNFGVFKTRATASASSLPEGRTRRAAAKGGEPVLVAVARLGREPGRVHERRAPCS